MIEQVQKDEEHDDDALVALPSTSHHLVATAECALEVKQGTGLEKCTGFAFLFSRKKNLCITKLSFSARM